MIKTIAESLNDMKKDAGLSNRKLAELSGVPEGTVNKILSGNTTNPSLESVEAMVRAMGRSMDELLGESETPEQIQTAVIDHYALLIDSYKDQIAHYKEQIAVMDATYKEQIQGYRDQLVAKDAEHNKHLNSHRIALWALFIALILAMVFLGYLCIDALHCEQDIFNM